MLASSKPRWKRTTGSTQSQCGESSNHSVKSTESSPSQARRRLFEGLAVSVNAGRIRPRSVGQDEALVVREEVVIENSHGRDVNVSLLSERHAEV